MNESVVLLGEDKRLVGVTTEPAPHRRDASLGVVFLNAGMVHHVGPNRLYVSLARRLADRGIPSVRFDFSGIGDSPSRRRAAGDEHRTTETFQQVIETRAVLDGIAERWNVERFLLAGICGGGAWALGTALVDPRVVGIVPINPFYEAGDEQEQRKADRGQARFYLASAVRDPRRWRRFLSGKSPYRKIARSLASISPNPSMEDTERISEATQEWLDGLSTLSTRGARVLTIFSEGDRSLEDLRQILGERLSVLDQGELRDLVVLPRSDHTFTLLADRERLMTVVEDWVHHTLDPN